MDFIVDNVANLLKIHGHQRLVQPVLLVAVQVLHLRVGGQPHHRAPTKTTAHGCTEGPATEQDRGPHGATTTS